MTLAGWRDLAGTVAGVVASFWLAYLTIGLLVYGLWVLGRLVPPGKERATFVTVMLVWWAALVWQLFVWAWWLVGWVAMLVTKLFNPDHGPVARLVGDTAMWLRHWRQVLRRPAQDWSEPHHGGVP